VPLERLEAQICELAGNITAATCRFLLLVGDFDARRGWASWDLPSCAAWLSWKCQIAPGTGREHVRVARALRKLPVITAEFAAGRLSYAKVRALTRIASRANDADLAQVAAPMTAGQLERFVAAHRRASNADGHNAYAARKVTCRFEDDGSLVMSVRLPAEHGALLMQALRAAANDLEHPHKSGHGDTASATDPGAGGGDGVPAGTPGGQSLPDALVDVARAFLAEKVDTASNPDIYQVVVHVGTEALGNNGVPAGTPTEAEGRAVGHPAHPRRCHIEDGPAISPAVAQRLACSATVSWMLHDHDGSLLDVGRRHRKPSAALRRAVRDRDKGRCQYPACNSRRTDLHHVRHWAKGGRTALANLVCLCEAHHVIVHALGFVITPSGDGGFTFTRPDGKHMPNCPPLPPADGDLARYHDAAIDADTIVPNWSGDKLDLDLAVWASFANARVAAERQAGPPVPAG
jgi:Domain of unknown function (DUF222)